MSDPIQPSSESFLGIHGTALALREQRLQLLSANLANADTPGFKAQDLDFNAALGAALNPAASALAFLSSSRRPLSATRMMPGALARKTAAAAKPFITGMLRSSTATSGAQSRATSTAAPPSDTTRTS